MASSDEKYRTRDGECAIKHCLVKDAWSLSVGSVGTSTLTTIITTQYGIKMSSYLAGKLMKELDITSCQHVSYKRGAKEHVDNSNLLDPTICCHIPQSGMVW
ncbi:hypothetical protein ACK6VY_15460 [Proteus mirabilis]|uniref:hypothetical protein n=1 Tax=Proteus mirabilis TaxID=584 RepID=UPI0039B62417